MIRQHTGPNFKLIFAVLMFTFTAVYGNQSSHEVWDRSPKIQAYLEAMLAALDTTPPAPELLPEPEFTLGYSNTLYWNGDSIAAEASSQGWEILFYEISAYSTASGTLWGFVDADVNSATFHDLPTGITITYRLRYYALNTIGQYGLSQWSSNRHSIQDSRPPELLDFEILNLNVSGHVHWVSRKTIDIRIQAFDDDSGKVMQIAFKEHSQGQDQLFLYDIIPPSASVDTIIPYSIYAPAHELITLEYWVIDFAGQASKSSSESFFWWTPENMVCWPNPFNPTIGETSIIQINVPDITLARIFDPFGKLVRVLEKSGSTEFFEWDGRNGSGDIVSRGGYICVVDGYEKLYCKIAVIN